jgi:hypothetical protein
MKSIVLYRGLHPVRFLPRHNYELVARDQVTTFRSQRAARLAAHFAGIKFEDRTFETTDAKSSRPSASRPPSPRGRGQG